MKLINIDCYGNSYLSEILVYSNDTKVNFIYENKKKKINIFSYALFLDDAALNLRYLRYPISRRICLLIESPIRKVFQKEKLLIKRFRHIYTHRKSLIEKGKPFIPIVFGTSWLGDTWIDKSFEKTKLISFIGNILHDGGNGYNFRKAIARKLIIDSRVDCYGYGINEIKGKLEGLSDYAFSIAIENTQEDFYFTEKLIDCFLTDTVPIYWGCPSIANFFDKRGLLTFNSIDELFRIVNEINMDRYYEMIPFVKLNKKLAIENKLHNLNSLYERLAEDMLSRHGIKPPVILQPKAVRLLEELKRILTL